MTTTTTLTQPDQVETGDRAIRHQWILKSTPDEHHGDPGVAEVLAELRVDYDLGGYRRERGFYATLHRRERGSYKSARGYGIHVEHMRIGAPATLIASEPAARFSQKRLKSFAQEALAALLAIDADGWAQVAHYFDREEAFA